MANAMSNTDYTVVAVWRVESGGGHPLGMKTGALFGGAGDVWVETIDSRRNMPKPSTFGASAGEAVLAMWSRSTSAGGVTTFAVRCGADTASGGRVWTATTLVADWLAGTTAAVGAGLSLSELLVWGTALSPTQTSTLNAQYLGPRWGTTIPLSSGGAIVNVLPAPLPVSLPASLPTPACWLSSTAQSTLFSDSAGTTAVVPGDAVRRWADATGNGCHLVLPGGAAVWPHTSMLNGNPLVHLTGGGGGAFVKSPLTAVTGATGFTVVAVWRASLAGGHPFATGALAAFGISAWTETIDTDTSRAMPVPGVTCGVQPDDVLVVCWHRPGAGDGLSVLLSSSRGARFAWTAAGPLATGWLGATGYPKVADAAGCNVPMGELLVWDASLGSPGLATLSDYLQLRWGVGLPLTGSVTTGVLSPPAINAYALWDAATSAQIEFTGTQVTKWYTLTMSANFVPMRSHPTTDTDITYSSNAVASRFPVSEGAAADANERLSIKQQYIREQSDHGAVFLVGHPGSGVTLDRCPRLT
jgi:hypothetical protein